MVIDVIIPNTIDDTLPDSRLYPIRYAEFIRGIWNIILISNPISNRYIVFFLFVIFIFMLMVNEYTGYIINSGIRDIIKL